MYMYTSLSLYTCIHIYIYIHKSYTYLCTCFLTGWPGRPAATSAGGPTQPAGRPTSRVMNV